MTREQAIAAGPPSRSRTDGVTEFLHAGRTNQLGSLTESGADLHSESFAFRDLPRRKGPRPATLRGPLHIQCNEQGDPRHLEELTNAVLSWPGVESSLANNNSSNTIPLRLKGSAAGCNFAAFLSPREFGRILTGAPTIYLALPLACAHWAIVRGWAEPHYFCSHGLMPPGALVVYTPRDEHELAICYAFFLTAYSAASELSKRAGRVDETLCKQ